jgi:hypothetical protein
MADHLNRFKKYQAEATLPTGGTSGQVLAKIDEENYNVEWVDQSGGGYELNPTPPDLSASGDIVEMTVGETVSFGISLYLRFDTYLWKSDANSVSSMPIVAMALESKTAGQLCHVLLRGFIRNDSGWSWTPGGLLYASTSPGALSHTAPGDSASQVQIAGIAKSAGIIFFNPSYVLVEVA